MFLFSILQKQLKTRRFREFENFYSCSNAHRSYRVSRRLFKIICSKNYWTTKLEDSSSVSFIDFKKLSQKDFMCQRQCTL